MNPTTFFKKRFEGVSGTITNFMGRGTKWAFVSIFCIAVLVPLYWLFSNSLKAEAEYLATPPIIIPSRITIENFQTVFEKDRVGQGLFDSIIVATSTTFFSVLLGSLAAYALSLGKLGKKLRHFFAFWFLLQKMYPAVATAIPIYMVMRDLRIIDTHLSLIILNISFNLPMVIWLMMGFFKEVPSSIEESGKIDGCTMTRRFFSLILPIVKPGLISSAILTFVNAWNEFLFAVILCVRRVKTLPVIISGFITDRGLEWGPMAATATVIIVPVFILVWILQKDFVQGLASGSVKE